jgi:Molecular chaperone (small heat shock protein)
MVGIKRRRDDDWDDDMLDDFFEDFGFDFGRVNERLRKMMERMVKSGDENVHGPFVYGFSYKVGPDGKPTFQEFGNMPSRPSINSVPSDVEMREPLTDINYDNNKAYITFELPGIAKEDIDLKVSETEVTIKVENGPRKYHKNVELRDVVKPESAKAKFINGILDLTLDLEKGKAESGKSVNIE